MTERKKSILLVDDEPALVKTAGKALQRHFKVSTAMDGLEAMQRLVDNPLDCIVLDIEMPGMDGIEFLRSLRSSGDYTPVIITTGKSCRQYAEEAAGLDIQGYMIKPYSIAPLAEKINAVIDRFGWFREKREGIKAEKMHPGLSKAVEYLDLNYDKSLNATEVSHAAGISYSHMAALFRNEFGMSFTCYLNRLRVSKAKELLKNTDLTLTEIMIKVGFNTEQHFFSQFKRFTGVTPKSLRN